MNLFARINKVDEAARKVYGRAVQEEPDLANEIFDYEKSKPYFAAWSGAFAKNTDGKSVGNVRAMHGKVAAGKLTELVFNDADKAIDVCAEIVDDAEWKKVQSGVYTGFSIGGKYVGGKTEDAVHKGVMRYTANPSEISIVDSPCIPSARFSMVKADGMVEEREFDATVTKDDGIALRTVVLPEAKKGLYTVGWLARLVAEVRSMCNDVDFEQAIEGDWASALPETMRTALASLATALRAMVVEETTEVIEGGDVELAATPVIAKAVTGTAHKDSLQAIHDHAAMMGATCGDDSAKTIVADELRKNLNSAKVVVRDLNKALGVDSSIAALAKIAEMKASLAVAEDLAKTIAPLIVELEKYRKMPAPAKGALRVIGKAEDVTGAPPVPVVAPVKKNDGSVDDAATLIKAVHQSGGRPLNPQ